MLQNCTAPVCLIMMPPNAVIASIPTSKNLDDCHAPKRLQRWLSCYCLCRYKRSTARPQSATDRLHIYLLSSPHRFGLTIDREQLESFRAERHSQTNNTLSASSTAFDIWAGNETVADVHPCDPFLGYFRDIHPQLVTAITPYGVFSSPASTLPSSSTRTISSQGIGTTTSVTDDIALRILVRNQDCTSCSGFAADTIDSAATVSSFNMVPALSNSWLTSSASIR